MISAKPTGNTLPERARTACRRSKHDVVPLRGHPARTPG